MKMLITLENTVHFVQILYTYVFQHCQATGMQNGDEASPSIILANRALLVKMLITLDSMVFFVQFCMLMSSHWYVKQWRGLTEQHFGRSNSFSNNAHNSGPHGIFCSNFVSYCILTVARLHRGIILAGQALLVMFVQKYGWLVDS